MPIINFTSYQQDGSNNLRCTTRVAVLISLLKRSRNLYPFVYVEYTQTDQQSLDFGRSEPYQKSNSSSLIMFRLTIVVEMLRDGAKCWALYSAWTLKS